MPCIKQYLLHSSRRSTILINLHSSSVIMISYSSWFFFPEKCFFYASWYLANTSRHLFKWLFLGFSWHYLNTSSTHWENFLNSLLARYLLNTFSKHRRILPLTPPRYLMIHQALNHDTSWHLLDLSRTRVLYKDKG